MARGKKINVRRPSQVDVAVGQRIRIERLSQRLSQTELAAAIGVSFQQLQKYESGANRVGAGRLTLIADKLGVPLTTFFGSTAGAARMEGSSAAPLHLLTDRTSLRLLEAFNKLNDSELKHAIVRVVELKAERG